MDARATPGATPMFGGRKGIPRVPPGVRKQREMLGWRYYDSVKIIPGSTSLTSYKFFNTVSDKTTFQTNMTIGGYIPHGEVFEIKGICSYLQPSIIDWASKISNPTTSLIIAKINDFELGSWELKIGDKSYNKGPLTEIMSRLNHQPVTVKLTDTLTYIEDRLMPFYKVSGVYPLDVPVTLEGGMSFYVEFIWNSPISLETGTPIYVFVELLGRRERRAIG